MLLDVKPVLSLRIVTSKFKATSAQCIYIIGVSNATVEQSTFTNNKESAFYSKQSTVTFLSGNLFSNNNGSVYAFNSKLTLKGPTTFSNNYHSASVYAVQSQIHFKSPEVIKITNNTASLGGGIHLRESTMFVSHPIEISHNTAEYGGGIYAYLSSIKFTSEKENKQIVITNNNANQNGGGICAVASVIEISRPYVSIDSNTALVNGGGIYIEQSTRVSLLKHIEYIVFLDEVIFISISNNLAQYGGGIFVEDKTAGEGQCNGRGSSVIKSESNMISSSECFIQFIKLYTSPFTDDSHYVNTLITDNKATISGDAIYGGLLDRCTVSSLAEVFKYASNGLDYISKTVAFANPEIV